MRGAGVGYSLPRFLLRSSLVAIVLVLVLGVL
jgi:hypothetical protein